MEYFVLSNGVKIPKIGLGASHSGGFCKNSFVFALSNVGYRLIDTAKRYGNEALIQEGIIESGIPRSDLFLTSKLWCDDYGNFHRVQDAFEGSCKRLGTNYLDLYLLHWPLIAYDYGNDHVSAVLEETWRSLEVLYDEDKVRAIGVCNFNEDDLIGLMENSTIVPHVLQSEFHVKLNETDLRQLCADHGIQFEGHCPLGKGKLLEEPAVKRIAEKHGRTPAQVLIRWSIQHGVVTIPKSSNQRRLQENFSVLDFELDEGDMMELDDLDSNFRLISKETAQKRLDLHLPDGYKLAIL